MKALIIFIDSSPYQGAKKADKSVFEVFNLLLPRKQRLLEVIYSRSIGILWLTVKLTEMRNEADEDRDGVSYSILIAIIMIILIAVLIFFNIRGIIRCCCYRRRHKITLKYFLCLNFCCLCYVPYLLFSETCRLPRKKSRPPKDDQTTIQPANRLFRTFNRILSFVFHIHP